MSAIASPSVVPLSLAVAAILVSNLSLALGDALYKAFDPEMPVWQLFFLRSVVAIGLLAPLLALRPRNRSLRLVTPGWSLLRSLCLAGMWVTYYLALPHVALSLAAAALYTNPFFIILLSASLNSDRVTRITWIASLAGFAGALLVLRPDTDDFSGYELLPLLAAFLYAAAMVITRTMCRDENPVTLSLWLNIVLAVGAVVTGLVLLAVPAEWRGATGIVDARWLPMRPDDWMLVAAMGLALVLGSVFAAYGHQHGPAPVIGMFGNAYFVAGVLLGLLMFGERPGMTAMLGTTLILAAGIVAARADEGKPDRPGEDI